MVNSNNISCFIPTSINLSFDFRTSNLLQLHCRWKWLPCKLKILFKIIFKYNLNLSTGWIWCHPNTTTTSQGNRWRLGQNQCWSSTCSSTTPTTTATKRVTAISPTTRKSSSTATTTILQQELLEDNRWGLLLKIFW